MQENYPFIRDDVLPSFWANAIQRFLSTYASFDLIKVSDSTIAVPAGANEDAAVCGIEGRWRWNEAQVNRAHPGGAAGIYDVVAVAADNDIDNTPQPFTDNTNYTFGLRIVATGTLPPLAAGVVDVRRKIGELDWDGAKIVSVTQLVGADPPSERAWAVGDVKPSLQGADHPGWLLCDGRTDLLRADYPAAFWQAMIAAGFNGDDATKFGVPDYRGRTLFGKGTHVEVNAFTDNDGLPANQRTPKHKTSIADPGHAHNVHTADMHSPDSGNWPNLILQGWTPGKQFDTGQNTNGGATNITAGPQDPRPVDTVPHGVVNWFIYDASTQGTAGSGGSGGGVSAPVTFRTVHTFAVKGAVNPADTLPSFFMATVVGQAVSLVKARYKIRAGTNLSFKVQRNGADIAGYGTSGAPLVASAVVAEAVAAQAIADNDQIDLVMIGGTGGPVDLTVTLVFEHVVG